MQKLADISMFEAISNQASQSGPKAFLRASWDRDDNTFTEYSSNPKEWAFYEVRPLDSFRDALFKASGTQMRKRSLMSDPHDSVLRGVIQKLRNRVGSDSEAERAILDELASTYPLRTDQRNILLRKIADLGRFPSLQKHTGSFYFAEGMDRFYSVLSRESYLLCMRMLNESLSKFTEEEGRVLGRACEYIAEHVKESPRQIMVMAEFLRSLGNQREPLRGNLVKEFGEKGFAAFPKSQQQIWIKKAGQQWNALFEKVMRWCEKQEQKRR